MVAGCSSGSETTDPTVSAEASASATPIPTTNQATIPVPTATIEIDPCTLLTPAEVESILGEAVGDGWSQEAISPAGNSCSYSTADITTLKKATLTIHSSTSIAEEGVFDSAVDVYNRMKRAVCRDPIMERSVSRKSAR